MPYTATKNGKTYTELKAEIDNATFKDWWMEISDRIYPSHLVDNLNSGGETEQIFYSNLQYYQFSGEDKIIAPKFPWTIIQTDMDALRLEKNNALTVEFDQLQLKKDLSDRLDAIENWKEATENAALYSGYSNKEVWKSVVIADNNELNIQQIEAEDISLASKYDQVKRVNNRKKEREFGGYCIDLLRDLNSQNNITIAQANVIFANSDIQAAISMLSAGSLPSAYELIKVMDITGLDPMTETERAIIVNELEIFLGV